MKTWVKLYFDLGKEIFMEYNCTRKEKNQDAIGGTKSELSCNSRLAYNLIEDYVTRKNESSLDDVCSFLFSYA